MRKPVAPTGIRRSWTPASCWGNDPYRYPDNLPIVAAKGGPGGKPGCGSLPDASKNYPVRYLVTDTGWGTGLDVRPNPGIGHPWWINYFPVTRAVPEPPAIHGKGPPASVRFLIRGRRPTARRSTDPTARRSTPGFRRRRQHPARCRRPYPDRLRTEP